jgi:hypothetical protein
VIAAEEAMRREHPAEYEKRKAEAYVLGEGNPSPVVVTFTTELACMAANEMLNRINGFRGPPVKNLVRKFHLLEDFKPGAKPRPGCTLCDDARYWATSILSSIGVEREKMDPTVPREVRMDTAHRDRCPAYS